MMYRFRVEYEPLNLEKLQLWIDSGRIDPSSKITLKTLRESGIMGREIKNGVKILGQVRAKLQICYHKIRTVVTSHTLCLAGIGKVFFESRHRCQSSVQKRDSSNRS